MFKNVKDKIQACKSHVGGVANVIRHNEDGCRDSLVKDLTYSVILLAYFSFLISQAHHAGYEKGINTVLDHIE